MSFAQGGTLKYFASFFKLLFTSGRVTNNLKDAKSANPFFQIFLYNFNYK